jgi:hypothetical protein
VAAFMVKPFGFEGPHRLMNEEDALRMLGTSADLALEFSNERLYGQSILRSIAVPADLAEKAGERFVLGNELGYFSACGRRANERLAQAIRLIDAASSGELGLRRDPLFAVLGGEEEAWWGMGSGMIGPRGLFEAVARASYWPLRKGRDFGKGKKIIAHVLTGEIRPKEDTGFGGSVVRSGHPNRYTGSTRAVFGAENTGESGLFAMTEDNGIVVCIMSVGVVKLWFYLGKE